MNWMFFFPLQIDTQCSGTQPENITITLKNDESLETAMLYSCPIRKHSIHCGNLLSISKTNTVALVTVNLSDYLTFSNHYTAVIGLVNKGGATESNFTISMCQRSSNSALFLFPILQLLILHCVRLILSLLSYYYLLNSRYLSRAESLNKGVSWWTLCHLYMHLCSRDYCSRMPHTFQWYHRQTGQGSSCLQTRRVTTSQWLCGGSPSWCIQGASLRHQ